MSENNSLLYREPKDVTALVIDYGLFIHVARRLAKEYKKVFYWSPWEKAFPKAADRCLGDGFPDIERVNDIWEVLDICDLVVFPALGFCQLQVELKNRGYQVWGTMKGDSLETNRGKFLKTLAATGLPMPKHEIIHGISNLRAYLKENEDKYIKVSLIRGDFETFHWRSWAEDESALDKYAVKFGPLKEMVTFYVFDPIKAKVEDGIDTYCIDGQWPKTVIHGMEAKDRAYLGTFHKYDDLPEELRKVNDAFGPVLESFGYRARFSTEVRITDEGEGYFIDPTCRFGSPPSQVEMMMVKNWGEIIWQGAHGNLVEMEPICRFGVQALIDVDRSSWAVMDIPGSISDWVTFGFCCCLDGKICIPPDEHGPSQIGWLTAIGDSIEEAINNLKSHAEELPDGVKADLSTLPELLEEVANAESMGMEFTDQTVPEPQEVV
jgi:hypothetical protein